MTQDLSELQKKIHELAEQKSIHSLIQSFLKNQKPPFLYFTFLPEPCAFKLSYSKPFIEPAVVRLYESEPGFKMDHLKEPMKIKALARIVEKVGKNMFSYLVFFKNQPFGLFFLSEKNLFIDSFFSAFQLKCEALAWKKQCSQLSNRQYLLKILFAEISRARNLRLPVSLVVIHCLSYDEIIKSNENQNLFLFFKALYNHISKNSRNYDSIIQISPKEMALVLPHTEEKSAMEKAEKIYWILNSLDYKEIFSTNAIFQIGVAEYPKVARDAVDLLKIAQLSSFSSKKGGVCLAVPINNFKPDFSINESFM